MGKKKKQSTCPNEGVEPKKNELEYIAKKQDTIISSYFEEASTDMFDGKLIVYCSPPKKQ
jgi:hypothetical protein